MATWVLKVVPSDMSHRGPDMYPRDVHLVALSVEVVGSEISEPLAGVSCGPLGYCRPVCQATNASYNSPPLLGLSCRLLLAASLPVEPWAIGLSPNRFAGWLVGSDRLSELESSSALLWLTGSCVS